MGFELYVPVLRINGIKPGQAAVDKNGNLRVHGSDLGAVGITTHAAVLLDRGTFRVALRKPADNEAAVKVSWNKGRTAGTVRVSAALTQIGVDVAAAAGRYDVTRKDQLQVVQFKPAKR